MSERELFEAVFGSFQAVYGGLEYKGTLVYYKGEIRFNTDGYNLLYNLTRLCGLLKDELL
jgi:hypothetical protein